MLKYSRSVELVLGSTLFEIDKPIKHVYFPIDGFISQTMSIDTAVGLEMGPVGNEGMVGASLLLGENVAPISAVVQSAGSALSMSAAQFCRALNQNPKLLQGLNHYLFNMMRQWAQSAFCAHYHQTEPRLARFLLMAHDRSHRTLFNLTQDALSKMLGVRRSSITVAASSLQRKKLIYYRRGEIDIVDRRGLEAHACLCYLHINKQNNRLPSDKALFSA